MGLLDAPARDWRSKPLVTLDAPRDLAGVWGWYDAANITGYTDGAALKAWGDESGHGNGVGQTTSANRPTYNATGLGGLGTVTFSATNWMTSSFGGPGSLIARPQPFTMVCLCKPRAAATATTTRYMLSVALPATPSLPVAGLGIVAQSAGSQDCYPFGYAGNASGINSGGRAINDGNWHIVVARMSSVTETVWVDGYVWSVATSQLHGANAATGPAVVLGACGITGGFPFDGDIAVAGFINADMSAKQVEYLTRAIATKRGL